MPRAHGLVSSWSVQDPSSYSWIEASILYTSKKGLREGIVCFQPLYSLLYTPEFTSSGKGKRSLNSLLHWAKAILTSKMQLLLWRLHNWLHEVCPASVGLVEELLIIVIIEHLVPDRPFVNALICFMSCCKLSWHIIKSNLAKHHT